jgi:hypothetical protein
MGWTVIKCATEGAKVGILLLLLGTARVSHAQATPTSAVDYDQISTVKSRQNLSAFLLTNAVKAVKNRRWSEAIPYYQALVVARGASSQEAAQLATLWTLAGQSQAATAVWSAYAAAATEPNAKANALTEVTRLTTNPDPFAEQLELIPATAAAQKSFAAGRRAFAAKQFGDALVYFHMGYALAPEMPGFLRELGATYDRLGASDKKREFYQRYLLQRPFGRNADAARKALASEADSLGTLTISTSARCEQLWINRQQVVQPLPTTGILVAPGTYKGMCFAGKQEMALFEYATVEAGKSAQLAFAWATIVNELTNPLGRIALENAKSPGVMIDLGISSTEVGVAVPGDRRTLKMTVKDDIGSRTETRSIQLEPGQRYVVRW